MSGALVLAESSRRELHGATAQLVSAAHTVCGEDVTLLVVGENAEALASRLNVGPVAGILAASVAPPAFEPHVVRAALDAAIRAVSPEVVVLAHTNDRLGVGPAVAAASGHGFASEVLRLARDEDGLIAYRSTFGGKLEAEITFDGHDTTVLLVRSAAFPAATGRTEAIPTMLALDATADGAIEHLGYEDRDAGADSIDSAEVLVAIGRGVEDPSQIATFEDLAAQMGGELVASRPLIDSGWVSASRQIGQSGAAVAPKVYLALGISGAAEHLAGIHAAETVIAVNNDASAPIFRAAHYGVIADLTEVSNELRKRLR